MINFRINKVFSDQNIKDSRYRETMIYFEHFKERAVFNNVGNVCDYFKQHLDELTEIIWAVDKDASP